MPDFVPDINPASFQPQTRFSQTAAGSPTVGAEPTGHALVLGSVAGRRPVWFCIRPEAGDPATRSLLEHGWFDDPGLQLCLDLLRPGEATIEVGSDIGTFALPAAAIGARVAALAASHAESERLRIAADRNGFPLTIGTSATSDDLGLAAAVSALGRCDLIRLVAGLPGQPAPLRALLEEHRPTLFVSGGSTVALEGLVADLEYEVLIAHPRRPRLLVPTAGNEDRQPVDALALPDRDGVVAAGWSVAAPPGTRARPRKLAVAADSISVRAHGSGRAILHDASFELPHGHALGILVDDGEVARALLEAIAGIEPVAAGEVVLGSRVVLAAGLEHVCEDSLTVEDNLGLVAAYLGGHIPELRRRMERVASRGRLRDVLRLPLRDAGPSIAAQVVLLAALECLGDGLLLLDSVPLTGDAGFRVWARRRLLAARRRGAGMIQAVLDPSELLVPAEDVLWLEGGRVRAFAARDAIFEAVAARRGEWWRLPASTDPPQPPR